MICKKSATGSRLGNAKTRSPATGASGKGVVDVRESTRTKMRKLARVMEDVARRGEETRLDRVAILELMSEVICGLSADDNMERFAERWVPDAEDIRRALGAENCG